MLGFGKEHLLDIGPAEHVELVDRKLVGPIEVAERIIEPHLATELDHAVAEIVHKRAAPLHHIQVIEPFAGLLDYHAHVAVVDVGIAKHPFIVEAQLAVHGHICVEARFELLVHLHERTTAGDAYLDALRTHELDGAPCALGHTVRHEADKRAVDIEKRRLDHQILPCGSGRTGAITRSRGPRP